MYSEMLKNCVFFLDNRPNVHDESFLRRCIPDVWHRRYSVSGERPGRSHRPDDFHISQDDQMHFPQVRCIRRGGDARLHMHPAVECRQRKNLRFPVVLVHDTRSIVSGRPCLQV